MAETMATQAHPNTKGLGSTQKDVALHLSRVHFAQGLKCIPAAGFSFHAYIKINQF